jgi:hypothetical protein
MVEQSNTTADEPTFEDLCSMVKRGMSEEQVIAWATSNNVRITEEQADYLERELDMFDVDVLIDETAPDGDKEKEASKEEVAPSPDTSAKEKEEEEPKRLTATEKRNAILGVLIVLSVLIALRRFLFG